MVLILGQHGKEVFKRLWKVGRRYLAALALLLPLPLLVIRWLLLMLARMLLLMRLEFRLHLIISRIWRQEDAALSALFIFQTTNVCTTEFKQTSSMPRQISLNTIRKRSGYLHNDILTGVLFCSTWG